MNFFPWLPRDWVKRTYGFVQRVVRGLLEHSALDHAASMSFYFFLGMFPLLVFAGHLLASFIDSSEQMAQTVLQLAPPSVKELIVDQLRTMAGQQSRSVAPLSLLGFLILTSNGVHNLMDVLELVTRAPHRPWWKQRLISILSVIGMLEVGIGVSWLVLRVNGLLATGHRNDATGLAMLLNAVQELAANTWQQLGVLALCGALLAVSLAAFYRYGVSYPQRVKRRVWAGTFVAIGCWVLFSWAFSTYVSSIGQYAVYYGSLATVATLLVWFYLTSLSILLGAEVNAQLEGLRDPYNTKLRPKKSLAGYNLRPGMRADATPLPGASTPLPISGTPLPVTATPAPGTVSPFPSDLPPRSEHFSTPPPPPLAEPSPVQPHRLDQHRAREEQDPDQREHPGPPLALAGPRRDPH